MVGFWLDFQIFGIPRFESRFPPVDEGVHSHRLSDAFERVRNSYGVYAWPGFSTSMVHTVVGFGPFVDWA